MNDDKIETPSHGRCTTEKTQISMSIRMAMDPNGKDFDNYTINIRRILKDWKDWEDPKHY